jgi:hypothetical protein
MTTSEGWPDKRVVYGGNGLIVKMDGLWWEWPYKRGGFWLEWPYKRGGFWLEWPYKRGGSWLEWPYKSWTTVTKT